MEKKTALITGASSGIGLELAHMFARDGYGLVLVARSKVVLHTLAQTLEQKFGVKVEVWVTDLADPSAVDELDHFLKEQELHIDVLVNNAGFGLYGDFVETDEVQEVRMMQLNMVVLTQLTKRLLPSMIARRQGRILNVASTASFQPGPYLAVYSATKAYVLSFSEAIAEELHGTCVTVTALCPGPTATGFERAAKLEKSKLFKGKLMDARAVAQIGYEALMRGQRVVISGFKNRFMAQIVRFTPRRLVTKVAKSMMARAGH